MKNFKKSLLVGAVALAISGTASADAGWISDTVLRNLEKLGGTQQQLDGVAGVIHSNSSRTSEYTTQLGVLNTKQQELDAAFVDDSFSGLTGFDGLSTSGSSSTIAQLVLDVEAELSTLDNTRSTSVDEAGVVSDLFGTSGIFTNAISSKLTYFGDHVTGIGSQVENLVKNIADDILDHGSIQADTKADADSLDAAIANVKSQATVLATIDVSTDYSGSGTPGVVTGEQAGNPGFTHTYVETSFGLYQLRYTDGDGNFAYTSSTYTLAEVTGGSINIIPGPSSVTSTANEAYFTIDNNSVGAGAELATFDFGTGLYTSSINSVANLGDLSVFSSDTTNDSIAFSFTADATNDVLLNAVPVIDLNP